MRPDHMRITITGAVLAMALTMTMSAGCDEQAAPSAAASANPAKQVASDKIEASLAAAQEYVQQGEVAKAEAILRTLIDRAPSESRAHEMLGQVLIEKASNAERSADAQAS